MIDPSVFIAPGAKILGEVTIGRDSSIWYNSVVRGDLAPVSIGAETNIQDLSVLHVDEAFPYTVGSRVGVGHRAILHGCTVEDECLIGMGAVLLNGVHVGAGSVIGAGALLPEGMKVPPGSVVLGIPARVVREVDDELRDRIRITWQHYLDQARSHQAGQVKVHVDYRPTDL
jgi:carbonic anhydrase/acetyltransferase-like protein (isoleucine patch superfamily)